MSDDNSSPGVDLFQQIAKLTEQRDVRETIPALSGVLVRELASAVGIYNMPADMPARVTRVILEDALKAIRHWREMPKH